MNCGGTTTTCMTSMALRQAHAATIAASLVCCCRRSMPAASSTWPGCTQPMFGASSLGNWETAPRILPLRKSQPPCEVTSAIGRSAVTRLPLAPFMRRMQATPVALQGRFFPVKLETEGDDAIFNTLLGVCVMRSDEGRDSVPSALFRDIHGLICSFQDVLVALLLMSED